MSIELHTWNTPNGRKISVALEEMELPYTVKTINISKGEQFDPAFLKISPNNRIPAIIDPEGPGGKPISIFESGAMSAGAGARMADVADGRLWTDARPDAPFPASRQRAGPALWSRALCEGNSPALRSARQAARRSRLRRGGDFDRRFRDPRLGLAARAPSGRSGRLSQRQTLVRGDDGSLG